MNIMVVLTIVFLNIVNSSSNNNNINMLMQYESRLQ